MCNVVWEDQLDGRFNCRVERTGTNPYEGTLYVTDALQGDKVLLTETVSVSCGAPFGADISDVEEWSAKVVDFIDHRYYR